MRYFILVILLLLLTVTHSYAQPQNDECSRALVLSDVANYCSENGEFNNVRATESLDDYPGCIPNNQVNNDVWFSFVAQAPNVSISVTGAAGNFSGGTLNTPQFSLYSGSCGTLAEVSCKSDATNQNKVNAIITDLTVGETYFISVGARFGRTGTFRLCVNNFNDIPDPSADCRTGVILCDKSPFTVPSLVGEGQVRNEIGDVSCNSVSCDVNEMNSVWYKWTCDQSGTLTFSITPLDPADDLDFVLYELPGGLDDCANKRDIRCMASGENVGSPFSEWFPCSGATGLSEADPDQSEACGCQTGNNNFARAADLVQGRSYVLVIFNFSQSGSGFSIDFGGTSSFVGPEADFTPSASEVCVGESITFTDNSNSIDPISEYTWQFGPGAVPAQATGRGPHTVTYNRSGRKTILLEIETNRGCIVSEIEQLEVTCCSDHFATQSDATNESCGDAADGSIDLSVSSGFGPIIYTWSNGASGPDLTSLAQGDYSVTFTDAANCRDSLSFSIVGPPPYAFDTTFVMPTCDGGRDGVIELGVTGGSSPYEFSLDGGPFGASNRFTSLSQGTYQIGVRDANGCDTLLRIDLNELELTLLSAAEAVQDPSCFGFSNGVINAAVANGLPPYQYRVNGGTFQPSSTFNGLTAGDYRVEILDANRCQGSFELTVGEPPALVAELDADEISCFGLTDGRISVLASGGVGDYTYAWSNGSTTTTVEGLTVGNYTLTVTDANNCTLAVDTVIGQPDPFLLEVLEITNNLCFGEGMGTILLRADGGNEPYGYSADSSNFQPEPLLTGLTAGDYRLWARDINGCLAVTAATITQPAELIVDAGPDVYIQLGNDTTLLATSNYRPVTFSWAPDTVRCLSADCSRITVFPVNRTSYTVTVINEAGCAAEAQVTVFVVKDRPIYVPNVFSPNSDGVNDGFTLFGGIAARRIERLTIYDRWGNLVFQTEGIALGDASAGWDGSVDGKPVNAGVFVYVAEVSFIDGETVQYEGDVTVVR